MRTAVLLLTLGCGGPVGADPDATPVDTAPADSGAAPTEPPVPTEGDTGRPLGDDGYLRVVWSVADDEPPTAFVVGQLYDEVAPGVAPVAFAEPEGVDGCAATAYTVDDLARGVLPTHEPLPAGALTLAPPSGVPVVVKPGGDGTYYADLDPHAVPFGGAYTVSAPGDRFPPLAGELALPAARNLVAPSPGFVAGGPLEVAWTGGDPGELLLRVEGSGDDGGRALVLCRVANDGAHTVPADLIALLPSGRVAVHLEQTRRQGYLVGERHVSFGGAVVHIVTGIAP